MPPRQASVKSSASEYDMPHGWDAPGNGSYDSASGSLKKRAAPPVPGAEPGDDDAYCYDSAAAPGDETYGDTVSVAGAEETYGDGTYGGMPQADDTYGGVPVAKESAYGGVYGESNEEGVYGEGDTMSVGSMASMSKMSTMTSMAGYPSAYPMHMPPGMAPPGMSMAPPMSMMPPQRMLPQEVANQPSHAAMAGESWQPRKISPEEAAIVEEPWYYRNINRQDAEAMLQPEVDGCFVVRPGRQVGTFVLSVKTGGQYSHIQITARVVSGLQGQPLRTWVLGAFSHPHNTIQALIKFHHENPIEIDGRPWVCLRPPQKGY